MTTSAAGDPMGFDAPFEDSGAEDLREAVEVLRSLKDAIAVREIRSVPRLFNQLFRSLEPLHVEIRYREWEALYKASAFLMKSDLSYAEARMISLYVPRSVFRGHESLVRSIRRAPAKLSTLSPRAFEEMIAFVFQEHGFDVELTAASKDGGRDLVAVRTDLGVASRWLVECKRYAKLHPVGVDLVRQLYGVAMSEQANRAILVTTSSFTRDAREFATNHPWLLDLRDGPGILKWLDA